MTGKLMKSIVTKKDKKIDNIPHENDKMKVNEKYFKFLVSR